MQFLHFGMILTAEHRGQFHSLQDGNKFYIQFTNWPKYNGTGITYLSGCIKSKTEEYCLLQPNMNATLTSATVWNRKRLRVTMDCR